MNPQGIFVVKDKENAVAQIEHLCKKYNSITTDNLWPHSGLIVKKRSTCSKNVLPQKCKVLPAANDLLRNSRIQITSTLQINILL